MSAAPIVRPWSPRAAIAPRVSGSLDQGLVAESNGSPGCYGGWELVYPPGAPGAWSEFSVAVRWDGVRDGFESLSVEARWEDEAGAWIDWAPIREQRRVDGWLELRGRVANLAGAARLVIKLLLRWTPSGRVEWRRPQLVAAAAPGARRVRLGAGSSRLPAPSARSFEDNRDRHLELCRRAGREGIGLLCLPEVILSYGLPALPSERLAERAVALPGPQLAPFQQIAAEHGMALCFSVLEAADSPQGGLVFNTAVLIDERGHLAATYRKAQLALPDEAWSGTTPGDGYPVARATAVDAQVGMNICMDSSVMEAARAVARQGAEVLMLPIMGDYRADRWSRGEPRFDIERWLVIMRMRALDNQLHLVVARNEGVGSCIVAPDGGVLALDGGDRGLVWADVDLAAQPRSWTGATMRDQTWASRRESTYGVLSGELQPRCDAPAAERR